MVKEFIPTGYKKMNSFVQVYQKTILTIIACISCGIALYVGSRLYVLYTSQNAKAPQLFSLAYQDTALLKTDPQTQALHPTRDDIDDLINASQEYTEEKEAFDKYRQLLANPYTYFLQHTYLPSLNIWKNPYTNEIDTTLVGEKFLQENPFTDLALIQTRVRAFEEIGDGAKELGVTALNQVKDITFSPIKEFDNGYFAIPVSLTFESRDRRSLLLLMEKLSMTSHNQNIALINEFFFHVREAIKQEYEQELQTLSLPITANSGDVLLDKKLGYLFDKWVYDDQDDPAQVLANQRRQSNDTAVIATMDDILQRAIADASGCTDQSRDQCYYMFREKFRTLPYLIYPITNTRRTTSAVLKEFLGETLPPVIDITSFTFDQSQTRGSSSTQGKFQGVLTIQVYGRGITKQEIQEIATALGQQCFVNQRPISPEEGLAKINNTIVEISNIDALDTQRAEQLLELRDIIQVIQDDFAQKTPFNKVIKLFEIYRMLNEAGLCEL